MTVKAMQNSLGHISTAKSLVSNSGIDGRRRFGRKAVVLALVLASASLLTALLASVAARQPAHTTAFPLIATTIAAAVLKERLSVLTWPRLLEEEEVLRGLSYYGSGRGLHRLAAKLLAGQPVKIVAIGGSVTAWAGGDPAGEAYIARFFQYINNTFPHPNHQLFNKGMSAWNSAQFEPCLERTVPQDADLVVVEFAINDASTLHEKPQYNSVGRRGFEQLLRRLQAMPSQPSLLLLQLYPWWQAFGDGVTQGLYYREPENQMTVLGQYYDIPVVSLRAAAWRLMSAGIEGYKVDKVLTQPNRNFGNTSHVVPLFNITERGTYFFYDCVHPDAHGLRVVAELLIHPVARAAQEVAAGLLPRRRADPRLEGLPPPMIPGSPDLSPSTCYMLEDFKPLVNATKGFVYQPLKPDAANFVQQKWGYLGTQPGDWAEVEVSTQLDTSHPQTKTSFYLTYLTSWKGMGTARVTCTSGCECKPMDINAKVPMAVTSVFFNRLIVVSQHPRCRVRVTILDTEKPDREEGQRFMIAAVMVRSGAP